MVNTNELIIANKILSLKLSVRKAAKQLGLRRDDFIRRMKEILVEDTENIEQFEMILLLNKILFDDMSLKEAAIQMHMTEAELDKKILSIVKNNSDKQKRYKEYKKKQKINL